MRAGFRNLGAGGEEDPRAVFTLEMDGSDGDDEPQEGLAFGASSSGFGWGFYIYSRSDAI